jgi:hypothetical protein
MPGPAHESVGRPVRSINLTNDAADVPGSVPRMRVLISIAHLPCQEKADDDRRNRVTLSYRTDLPLETRAVLNND